MAKNVFQPRTEEEREFKKVLESIDYSKNRYEIFCDWILCCGLSFAQGQFFTPFTVCRAMAEQTYRIADAMLDARKK